MSGGPVVRERDAETVASSAPFDLKGYLARLDIGPQRALAAAYDAACAALIGENDTQRGKDGNLYKKKSAWRKLGRHFGISVHSSLEDTKIVHFEDGEWCAFAHAAAIAPWGQRFDDVAACGSDEELGNRTITYADAVATAMTRAANRAVSNLIAMGEVSAEEINDRGAVREREALPVCPVCEGPMWDNRNRKRNPNAPDLRCKDRDCAGVYQKWPVPVEAKMSEAALRRGRETPIPHRLAGVEWAQGLRIMEVEEDLLDDLAAAFRAAGMARWAQVAAAEPAFREAARQRADVVAEAAAGDGPEAEPSSDD